MFLQRWSKTGHNTLLVVSTEFAWAASEPGLSQCFHGRIKEVICDGYQGRNGFLCGLREQALSAGKEKKEGRNFFFLAQLHS